MRRLAALAGALTLAGLLLILLLGHGQGGSVTAAAAQASAQSLTADDSFEPVLGLPAMNVHVLGSSPLQESEEAWAYGTVGGVPAVVNGASYANQLVLLKHTGSSGWQVVPLPSAPGGGPLSTNVERSEFPRVLGSLGGRVTAAGGVVLLSSGGIVVRDPNGLPRLVSEPTAMAGAGKKTPELLGEGESLPPTDAGAATAYAATDEVNGHTGMLIAPYGDGAGAEGSSPAVAGPGVLHYDGEKWTREAIAWTGSKEEALTPQALACGGTQASANASSPENCWLLASYHLAGTTSTGPNRLALFRRAVTKNDPSTYTWEREQPDWLLGEEQSPPAGVTGARSVTSLGAGAQTLTVTSQGVWVDFQAKLGGSAAAIDFSELVTAPTAGSGVSVAGTWCYPAVAGVCEHTLGAPLPGQYRSFASPGASAADLGTRLVAGLPHGIMLEFSGGDFQTTVGAGGSPDEALGAAFDFSGSGAIERGWIGEGEDRGVDYQGQSQLVEVTPRPVGEQSQSAGDQFQPAGDQLQQMPVPFRHPLLALAQAPGTTPGEPGAGAIAVGAKGEIGRFLPGQGWRSESLYNSSGEAVTTPTLRGVAWPEPGRAYAVGDEGTMWLWRADTGLWEPDPAAPYNFIGDLTAVAFSPSEPALGYAVGKQGVLLKHGKTWIQEPTCGPGVSKQCLPAELAGVNFTSVAFAGDDALATYRVVGGGGESGGLAIEDGSGWRVDPSAAALLAQVPSILSRVAGLPDGGAVAAGPGLVIERESSGAPWHFSPQPLPEADNVSALAAYREAAGPVQAVVSIDLDPNMNPNYILGPGEGAFSGDLPPLPGTGQPPPHLSPDPLPDTGYVLKETVAGWSDIEHMALEAIDMPGEAKDVPVRPDPVLALLVAPSGGSGFAVGGQTDDTAGTVPNPDPFETAAAMRFGASEPATAGQSSAPIATTKGDATFAVGGGAVCAEQCADFAGEGLAPEVLLTHALQSANQIAADSPGGLRGFLYTGSSKRQFSGGEDVFSRVLPDVNLSLPVLAPSAFGSSSAPPSSTPYYPFRSVGAAGGEVEVLVLDYSTGELGEAQLLWLKHELQKAKEEQVTAIAMGSVSLGFTLPESIGQNEGPPQASDAAVVSKTLVEGGASAYLFDYPGVNVTTQVSYGTTHIPAYGTGTLGYSSPPDPSQTDSPGSSGFLLLDIDTGARNRSTNVAPVSARVEPDVGELALQADDGVLLRRSHIGLFEALARVPPSGREVGGGESVIVLGPAPYEPIPFNCQGPDCADAVPTDYTFTSSNPDIGNFVAHETTSVNPRQVELGANHLPIADPKSGLFCAFNAGTTTVSITAGGLTYSEPVTVQAGSAEYPCGTVPLKNPPVLEPSSSSFKIPALSAGLPHIAPFIPAIHIAIPRLVLPVHQVRTHKRPITTVPFAYIPAQLIPILALVPPAPPAAARPIPPSGTAQVPAQSPVTQPVGIAEQEHQVHGATEGVHNMAAYSHADQGPMPAWPLGLILIAVAAGIVIRPNLRSRKHVYARESSR